MRRKAFISSTSLICAVGALMSWAASVAAEQLPLRHYGVYEGLPHSYVRCTFQDSRGYLWIGTGDGLARFDGYHFTTYDTSDGLGHPYINAITEDRQRRVWVATNGGGVSCFIDWAPPASSPRTESAKGSRQKFLTFAVSDQNGANSVNGLLFDSDGHLWCITDGGLYRANIAPDTLADVKFELVAPHRPFAAGAFSDSRGRLWFGNGNAIIEVVGQRIIDYGPGTEFGIGIKCFAQDRQGRLMAADEAGILEFSEPRDPASPGSWKPAPLDFSNWAPLHHLMVDDQGTLWVAAEHGLIKYKNGRPIVYTTTNGFSDNDVQWLDQDRDRNLWIGTFSGGLCMLSGEPAVGFSSSDGLPDAPVVKLFEDRAGHVYVSTRGGGLLELDDGKFVPLKWSEAPAFKWIGQRILEDSKGDWWVGTDSGLFLFQGPELSRARGRQITAAEGGPQTGVTGAFYEDPKGRIWFGSRDNSLFCIDRSGQAGRPALRRIPLS